MLLSEARRYDSYARLEEEYAATSAVLHQPPELVLDDDVNDSLSESLSGVYSQSKKRDSDIDSNHSSTSRRLGEHLPMFARQKSASFQTSVGEELKRIARQSFPGIAGLSNYTALSSSSLKESSQKGSTTLKQRAKVSASKLPSEYVQKLLKETSLKDQMEMQKAKSKGLSEGNQGRGVLEKFYELKTRQVRSFFSSVSLLSRDFRLCRRKFA